MKHATQPSQNIVQYEKHREEKHDFAVRWHFIKEEISYLLKESFLGYFGGT